MKIEKPHVLKHLSYAIETAELPSTEVPTCKNCGLKWNEEIVPQNRFECEAKE